METNFIYDEVREVWFDPDTKLKYGTKTGLKANVKRYKLGLKYDPFFSNRFVLNNLRC